MKKRTCFFAIVMALNIILSSCSCFSLEESGDSENVKRFSDNALENVGNDDFGQNHAMLSILWKQMLLALDSRLAADNPEEQWDKTYEVELYLQKFEDAYFSYDLKLVYPERLMQALNYRWPEHVNDSNVSEYYSQAEEYLSKTSNGKREYSADSDWIIDAKKGSTMQIVGQVTNETFAQANLFLDNLAPYTYYGMWGSVLKAAGEWYEEQTGSFLGKMVGQAYMMSFDFETLTGSYWICIEGFKPIKVEMRFHNQDCLKYNKIISEEAIYEETEIQNAWLGLSFDLETTRQENNK